MRGMAPTIEVMSLTVRDSGRKIIDILKRNPGKNPDSYEEEDIAHMRKVASYCKVHSIFSINHAVSFVFKGFAFVSKRRRDLVLFDAIVASIRATV